MVNFSSNCSKAYMRELNVFQGLYFLNLFSGRALGPSLFLEVIQAPKYVSPRLEDTLWAPLQLAHFGISYKTLWILYYLKHFICCIPINQVTNIYFYLWEAQCFVLSGWVSDTVEWFGWNWFVKVTVPLCVSCKLINGNTVSTQTKGGLLGVNLFQIPLEFQDNILFYKKTTYS